MRALKGERWPGQEVEEGEGDDDEDEEDDDDGSAGGGGGGPGSEEEGESGREEGGDDDEAACTGGAWQAEGCCLALARPVKEKCATVLSLATSPCG